MDFKLIYVSPNGTTRKTSEVLKDEIEKDGHVVELIDIGRKPYRDNISIVLEKLKEADIAGFGAPAYHMDMLEPMLHLFKEILASGEKYEFKAFLYLNYAGITSGKAFINIAKVCLQMHIPVIGALKVVAPHFHHKEIYPSDEIKKFIQNFYFEVRNRNFAPVTWERLSKILSPQKKRVNFIYPLVHFIGKKRELQIIIKQEICKGCGKCVNECPAGAISLYSYADIDFSKCIHCYHCVAACKLKAVEAPIEKIDEMIRMNKKIIGIENPQNQIYL